MSTHASLPHHESRTWTSSKLARDPLQVGRPGIAEIKPHTGSGLRSGLNQLRRRATDPRYAGHDQWLVTYRAVNQAGQDVRNGQAAGVNVRAARVVGSTPTQFFDLGTFPLPAQMPFPRVDQPGFFGMAVEGSVRDRFRRWLPPDYTSQSKTGGSAPGPDVVWKELAGLYSELALEMRDSYYAALATELSVGPAPT